MTLAVVDGPALTLRSLPAPLVEPSWSYLGRVGLAGPSPIRSALQMFFKMCSSRPGLWSTLIDRRVASANRRCAYLEDGPWRIADGHNAKAPFGWALAMSRANLPTCGGTAGFLTSQFSV
jgi:hypothetical protein